MTPAIGSHTFLGERVRDLSTDAATWISRQTTIGEYLNRLGIYDAEARIIDESKIPDSEYQRNKIEINKNPIKKRMLRDLLRGGTLPAIVTVERADGGIRIADGLQRTHVLAKAVAGLLALQRDEEPSEEVSARLVEMADDGQKPLAADELLAQPLVEQVWRDLKSDEELRLFMVLNVGQQKVTPRHLLEVAQENLRATFQDWGIQLLSQREEKERPKRRGRPPKDNLALPGLEPSHYRYELLIESLQAYVTGNPHVKTRELLEGGGSLGETLSSRITEIGSEACRDDFQWICTDLSRRMRDSYLGQSRWETAAQTSDNFVIPLFAALGKARETVDAGSTVRQHQKELLDLLDQDVEDPLRLTVGSESLESIQGKIRSNIGHRQRAIAFFAWRSYFLKGPASADYPLNWLDGAVALGLSVD